MQKPRRNRSETRTAPQQLRPGHYHRHEALCICLLFPETSLHQQESEVHTRIPSSYTANNLGGKTQISENILVNLEHRELRDSQDKFHDCYSYLFHIVFHRVASLQEHLDYFQLIQKQHKKEHKVSIQARSFVYIISMMLCN